MTQILDASAAVFSEQGYDAATTNVIALRANTSIGSLYQFFPHKRAILTALADRCEGQLIALLDEVFADEEVELTRLLDRLIDRLADLYLANSDFQLMFCASQSSKELREVADGVCRNIIERVHVKFSASTRVPSATCHFYAEYVVHMMRALIPLIKQPGDREKILPELKRTVQAYLASTGCFDIPAPTPNMD